VLRVTDSYSRISRSALLSDCINKYFYPFSVWFLIDSVRGCNCHCVYFRKSLISTGNLILKSDAKIC
jgi:hypothetical protein